MINCYDMYLIESLERSYLRLERLDFAYLFDRILFFIQYY